VIQSKSDEGKTRVLNALLQQLLRILTPAVVNTNLITPCLLSSLCVSLTTVVRDWVGET